MEQQPDKKPEMQGKKAPPKDTRFKPGQSGNPAGRKSAGAYIKEWVNSFAQKDLSEDALRKIARDRKEPWTRRAAAERILRTMEAGDMAVFEPWLTGEKTLADLKREGVNTELLKKAKIKRIPTQNGMGEEREVEVNDRSGADFDRVMDRTEGKPTQAVQLDAPNLPAAIQILTPLTVVGNG